MLSEVTVLSRLNHPNVVRYFAAWIDDGIIADDHLSSESSEGQTLSSLTSGGHRSVLPPSSRGLDFISSSNAHIVFGNDSEPGAFAGRYSQDESSDDEDADQSSSSSEGQVEPAREEVDREVPSIEAEPKSGNQGQTSWTVLYIQMEYCRPEVSCLLFSKFEARRVGRFPVGHSSHFGQHMNVEVMAGLSPQGHVPF